MSEPSENSSAVQPTVPVFEVAFQKGMWWSIPAEMSQAIYEKYRLYKQEWQIAGGRMVTALKIYETKWQEVLNNESFMDEVAQRQRNTVITTKIIRLGVCIATAWAQSSAQTRSLADYVSNAGQ